MKIWQKLSIMFSLLLENLSFFACLGEVCNILSHCFPMKMMFYLLNEARDSWMKKLLMIPFNKACLKFDWNNNFVLEINDELLMVNVLLVFQLEFLVVFCHLLEFVL